MVRTATFFAALVACFACTSSRTSQSSGTGSSNSTGSAASPVSNGNNAFSAGPSLAVDSPYVHYIGRVDPSAPGGVRLAWPGSALQVRVTNSSNLVITALANQQIENNMLGVWIDGKPSQVITLNDSLTTYNVPVTTGDHIVTFIKRTESGNGALVLAKVTTNGQFEKMPAYNGRLIEVVGENVAAGYNSDGPTGVFNGNACSQPVDSVASPTLQNAGNTFGVQLAKAFNADWSLLAASGRGVIQNYDGSIQGTLGDLYPRLYPQDYTTAQKKGFGPQVVIINAGANDINYWLQNANIVQGNVTNANVLTSPSMLAQGFVNLFKTVRQYNPQASIIVTSGPTLGTYQCFGSNPNAGYACSQSTTPTQTVISVLTTAIKSAMTQMNDSKISFVAIPANTTNATCSYYPDAAGQQIMATTLLAAVQSATGWTQGSGAASVPASSEDGVNVLTGTFTPLANPLANDGDPNLTGIIPQQFPECHYCSPMAFNANAVGNYTSPEDGGAMSCPGVIGQRQPCNGYCHVPEGFVEPYVSDSPTSGNHYAIPSLAGDFPSAVMRGHWIHSMEHGAIVITYNCPNGCGDDLATIRAVMAKRASSVPRIILTPDPLLTTSTYAINSWTWSYPFSTVDANTLLCFIDQHAYYGRECLTGHSEAACPPLRDAPMSSTTL